METNPAINAAKLWHNLQEAEADKRHQQLAKCTAELLTTPFNKLNEALIHKLAQAGWIKELPEHLHTDEICVQPRDNEGWTPLHHSAIHGHWETLPKVFQTEKNLHHLKEKHGWNPFYLLAASLAPSVQNALSENK